MHASAEFEGAHLQPERRIMIDIGSDCVAARVPTVQYVLDMSTDCPLSRLTLNSSVRVCGCVSKQRLIGFVWGFQMRCLPLFTLVIDSIAAFLFLRPFLFLLSVFLFVTYNCQGTFLYTFFCVVQFFGLMRTALFDYAHSRVRNLFSANVNQAKSCWSR